MAACDWTRPAIGSHWGRNTDTLRAHQPKGVRLNLRLTPHPGSGLSAALTVRSSATSETRHERMDMSQPPHAAAQGLVDFDRLIRVARPPGPVCSVGGPASRSNDGDVRHAALRAWISGMTLNLVHPPKARPGDRIAVLSPSFAAAGAFPAVHEQAMRSPGRAFGGWTRSSVIPEIQARRAACLTSPSFDRLAGPPTLQTGSAGLATRISRSKFTRPRAAAR